MKKIFVLAIVCSLFANVAVGQKVKGKLSFFSQDGQKFWVVINGKKINTEPAYEVPEFEVDGNWGKARIIFQNPQIPAIDKNWQVTDADSNLCSVKYMIKKNKKGKYDISNWDATFEVIGKSTTTVTNTTTTVNNNPATTTNTEITETTTIVTKPVQPVEHTTTITTNTTTTGVNVNTNVNPNGINMNVNGLGLNITVTDPNIQTTEVTTVTTTTKPNTNSTTTTNIIAPNPNANKPTATTTTTTTSSTTTTPGKVTGCVSAMSSTDFANAKSSISSKPFEDSKMTVAKQIANANCLDVNQIKEIVQLFSFEDSKLDFAKHAYNRAVDKNNYYKINDVFNFSSTVEDLNEYISSQK